MAHMFQVAYSSQYYSSVYPSNIIQGHRSLIPLIYREPMLSVCFDRKSVTLIIDVD